MKIEDHIRPDPFVSVYAEYLAELRKGYEEAVELRARIAELEAQLAAGGEAKCKHGISFDSRWEDNAYAWRMVVKAIAEVMPDWWRLADKGQDAAVAAVRKLAHPQPAAPAGVPEWQPIETASAKLLPATGCAISERVLIAYDDFDDDQVIGKLISVGRLRRGGRGDATTEYWDSPSFDEIYEPPTHWMPLPAAPNTQEKEQTK